MGHGSQLVYISQPESLNVFNFLHASLIATISAWAVGSFEKVTLLEPSATIILSLTTTQPKGPPIPLALFIESSIALYINLFFDSI